MHKDTLYFLASQLQKEIRRNSLELNDLYIKVGLIKASISTAFMLRAPAVRLYAEKHFLDAHIAAKVIHQKERKKKLLYLFKIIKLLDLKGVLQ